jgi:hypothetical protein
MLHNPDRDHPVILLRKMPPLHRRGIVGILLRKIIMLLLWRGMIFCTAKSPKFPSCGGEL